MKELDAPVMKSIRRHHKELVAPVSIDIGAECSGKKEIDSDGHDVPESIDNATTKVVTDRQ
jgi:hypothetical protein